MDGLNATLNKLLREQELPGRLASEGADPIGGTRRQFADHINAELARWAEIVRVAKIKIK